MIAIQQSSGTFFWLPLGIKIKDKICQILREENNKYGLEVQASSLVHEKFFLATDRINIFNKEFFKILNRNKQQYFLAPTHEEVFASIIPNNSFSYKTLPIYLYQISNKYRDEIRPRGGILRSCNFNMKDGYSFSISQECLNIIYENIKKLYIEIFKKLLIDIKINIVNDDTMLGYFSEEFIFDNKEEIIEAAHIFKLGTVYTDKFNKTILNKEGKQNKIYMGSYGIGVDRLVYIICIKILSKQQIPFYVFKYGFISRHRDDNIENIYHKYQIKHMCLLHNKYGIKQQEKIEEMKKMFVKNIIFEENYITKIITRNNKGEYTYENFIL